jgi:hypothetical protein
MNSAPLRSLWSTNVRLLLYCVAVALVISLLPYLIWSLALGRPSLAYIGDPDNQLYLQIAANAYFNHPWYISDPARLGAPTHYPWLQFVPFVLLARSFQLGPFGVNVLWRLWAAAGMALGFYVVFWRYLKSRLAAAACAVFALTDSGLITAHPVVHQLFLLAQIVSGHARAITDDWPPIIGQWRVVDPAVGFPFVLLHVAAVSAARERPTRTSLLAAGATFGVLFYVYFYYWTAVAGGLALAFVLDAAGRRVYFHTAWMGSLVGAPGLVHDYLLGSALSTEAMQRFGYFVPMPRLTGLMLPRSTIVLLPLLLFWLWRTRRLELCYLWALALVGLVLDNLGAIIGLDLQQGHWRFIWGAAAEILSLILVVDWAGRRLRWSPMATRISLGALGLYIIMAVFVEGFDVLRTRACRKVLVAYQMYSVQQSHVGEVKLTPRSTIAGDERYVNLAMISQNLFPLYNYAVLISPTTTDHDWELRFALNAYLMGVDARAFRAQAQHFAATYQWGPWSYGESGGRPGLFAQLVSAYREVTDAPSASLDRFAVRYVALLSGDGPPPDGARGWLPVEHGTSWTVWERSQPK